MKCSRINPATAPAAECGICPFGPPTICTFPARYVLGTRSTPQWLAHGHHWMSPHGWFIFFTLHHHHAISLLEVLTASSLVQTGLDWPSLALEEPWTLILPSGTTQGASTRFLSFHNQETRESFKIGGTLPDLNDLCMLALQPWTKTHSVPGYQFNV